MNFWALHLSNVVFFAAAIVFSNFLLKVTLKTPVVNFFCDKPDARKVHSKPIPRIGGSIIVLTFLTFMIALLLSKNLVGISIPLSKNIAQVLLLSSGIIFICGLLDDTTFITMRVRYKIAAELLIALSAVYLFDFDFGQISIPGIFSLPLWIIKLVSVFWILGLINAFNMIDGVDGLAGGISLISILTLAVMAYLGGLTSVVAVCLILTGALIGFLYYNLPPAKTFMGDTGSLFLGTMIAVISLHLSKEIFTSRTLVVMPLIAGVPIIEVIVTMVRRYFKAKDSGYKLFDRLHSMVVADNSHIHHRLIFLGFSHLETTAMLCTLSFTLCCGALCLFLVPSYAGISLIVYLAVPVVLVLDQLGFGGRFKKALHLSATRYNGYKKKSLVGVIDQDGTTFHLLKKKNNQNIEYVPITDEEIPGISRYLKAVIVNKNSSDSKNCLGYAEQVSTLIKGPIFIVSPDTSSRVSILEVFKNGSLNVKEKKGSIIQLAKEMKKVSAGNVYTHH